MRTLPTQFRSDGFDFEQLAREGDIALFRKTKPEILTETFEVVVIQHYEERTIAENLIEASEAMPPTSQWGKLGWSLQTRERAWEKFRELR